MKLTRYVSENWYKIFKTFFIYISFAGLGGASTLLGSSLLDVQIRVQESFEVTSRLVPTRAIGYIIGASTSGFFEKFSNDNLVLSVSNLVAGIFLVAAPWFYQFVLVAAFMFVSGYAQGIFDIYCNVVILKIWGENNTNWLQVLHMFFGVGALLTPLFTRPFLLPLIRDAEDGLDGMAQANGTFIGGYSPDEVKIQYPYLILGGILVLASIPFFLFYLKERTNKTSTKQENKCKKGANISRGKKYGAVIMAAMIANLAFGIEVVIGTLGPAFSVKSDLKMSKQTGALLATVFWSMVSFYRLIFVPLTMIIREERLVMINLLILLTSVIVMIPHAAYNQIYTWISFTLLGIGISPLFAIAYGSLSNYFEVTGKMTSFVFVNGVLGESMHTTILAKFLDSTPQVYVYYLGSMGLLYGILCFMLPIYCKKLATTPQVSKKIEDLQLKSVKF